MRAPRAAGRLLSGRTAAIISGLLLGLSYPPFPFPFIAWFAFVPLLLAWSSRADGRGAFLDAYLALLVTFGVAFQWPLFHELPATALLSLPPLLVLPMWIALPFGVAHFVRRRWGVEVGLGAWVVLSLLAEYGLRSGPFAFPWMLLGHTQSEVGFINGLAAIGGVPLLSLLVLLSNAVLFLAVRRSGGLAPALIAAGLLIAGAAMHGSGPPIDPTETTSPAPTVRIAGIQPALSPTEWADLRDSSRVTMLLGLSRGAATSDATIDLIVWPETAIPPYPTTRPYVDRIQSLVDSTGISILAGAITTGGSAYRNSAILVSPRTPVQTYDKVNLVPFAERVPFAGTIPFLERFAVPAGGVSGYVPGADRVMLEIPELRFGVLICFETLFAGAARAYAREGADVLIAITQDGWWGDSFGYRQHLAFNRLRAIETGLPMIQSAVTGVSALIHPNGSVERKAGWMERAVWMVDVPPPAPATPYVRVGDWVTLLAALVACIAMVWHGLEFGLKQLKRRRHAS